MTMILLVDLDDTLLHNNINTFLPSYLKALSGHLSSRFQPDPFVKQLLSATRCMVENHDPAMTLEEVFDQTFYPALGTTRAALNTDLETFYREIYPGLETLTRPKTEAQELVRKAFERDYRVVVATNPLFPATAIYQRLEWAGLSPQEYPFALITTYENMHFTKPNPAYYAEILGQLGWPDAPAVMVGNDLSDDIRPARALGLPTYYLNDTGNGNGSDLAARDGRLEGVRDWLEHVAAEVQCVPVVKTPEALLAYLRSTPAALNTLTAGYTHADWAARPGESEWSAGEILCHLRDVDAEINLPRFERIVRGENPFLPGINSDVWAVERDYAQYDGPAALNEFLAARKRILALLEGLDDSGWNLPARHAIFGPTTLLELVSFTVTHDRNHIQQVWCNPCGE